MNPAPRMPDNRPLFVRKQYEFAAHIRDPEGSPKPGDVDERRMAVYRELFYNNVEGFIANTFPVLRQLMSDDNWHALVRDFFIRHRAKTPLFLEIPEEFIAYLQSERTPQAEDPPFLLELAHYEWVELALSIAEETIEQNGIDPQGDLFDGIPVVSPLAWALSYRYPVHHIGPEYRPEAPDEQPTHLVVYRDREDEIGFLAINPVTARLLTLLEEDTGLTGRAALERIAQELQHPNPQAVIDNGRQILEQLRQRDILLGTRAL